MKRDRSSGQSLLRAARKARLRARATYSSYKVGAALETSDGSVYSGCNIENASYGLSMCAERVALFKALSEGAKKFRSLAIVTGADEIASPCGACRQILWEYCGNIPVHLGNLRGKTRLYKLAELLPHPFDRSSVAGHQSSVASRRSTATHPASSAASRKTKVSKEDGKARKKGKQH
jgi:cytidine deaminase